MADLTLHCAWLAQDGLPPVCLRTGKPTGGAVWARSVTVAPSWTWLLFPVGIVGMIVVRSAMGTTVNTRLPTSRGRRRGHTIGVVAGLVIVLVGFGWLIPAMLRSATVPSFLAAAVVAIGAAIIAATNRWASVGFLPTEHQGYVRLTRVHPIAVDALQGHMRAAHNLSHAPGS